MKKQGNTYVADGDAAPQAADGAAPFGNEAVNPDSGEAAPGGSSEEEDAPEIPARVEHFDRSLKCVLTGEELVRFAREMGEVNGQVVSLTEEKKSTVKSYDAKIAEKAARLGNLGTMVNQGWEPRSVRCSRVFDYESGMVIEVREDTHEELEARKMTQNERQREFNLFEKNNPKS